LTNDLYLWYYITVRERDRNLKTEEARASSKNRKQRQNLSLAKEPPASRQKSTSTAKAGQTPPNKATLDKEPKQKPREKPSSRARLADTENKNETAKTGNTLHGIVSLKSGRMYRLTRNYYTTGSWKVPLYKQH